MAANDKNLELQIRAKNLTQEAFNKVSQALKLLEDQQQQTTSRGTTSWGKWFATIGGGVAVGNLLSDAFKSAASHLADVPNQLIALGERGADVKDVRGAFEGLTRSIGQTSSAMLGELRSAFGGTVDDFELMKSSNEALGKGVKLTADDMGVLGRASRVMADQVGGDAKDAFDSLLTGIANGQERQLKQLPLNFANIERAVESYADSLGKEVSALDESERQTALRNAVLEESKRILAGAGEVENDFADNVAAARVQVQNWTDSIGQSISTAGPMIAGLGGLAQSASVLTPILGASGLAGAASGLAGILLGPIGLVAGVTAAAVAFTLWKTSEIREKTNALAEASRVLGQGVSDVGAATNILKAHQAGLTGQQLQLTDAMGKAVPITTEMMTAYMKGKEATKSLGNSQAIASHEIGATSLVIGHAATAAQTAVQKYKALEDRVRQLTTAQREEIEAAEKIGGPTLDKVLKKYDLTEQHLRVLHEVTKDNAKAAKEFEDAAKSLVDRALKGVVTEARNLSDPKNWASIQHMRQLFEMTQATTMVNLQGWLQRNRQELLLIPPLQRDWTAAAAETNAKLQEMLGSGGAFKPATKEQIHKWLDEAKSKTYGWRDSLVDVASAIDAVGRVSSGTFGSIVSQLANVVRSWQQAAVAVDTYNEKGKLTGAQKAQLGVAAVQSGADVITATGSGTKTQRAVGGAMSGMSAGLATGLMFGAKFGPYGAAIGAAAGLIVGLVRGANQGRKSIKDFAQEFGGFDGLREKLNALGEEGDRLWVNLTQKVKNGDVKAAQAAIEAVTLALEKQTTKQKETAEAAQAAAQATVDAQAKVIEGIQSKLDDLNQEYDQLWESIKDEAPEEEMGVIEKITRARMDAIAEQRKGVQAELDQAQAAQAKNLEALEEAMNGLTEALQGLTEKTWKIPVEVDYRDRGFRGPQEPIEPEASYARGGIIGHDQVARVHAGELIGPVDFVERALAGAMVRTGGGSGGRTMLQPIIVQVEGREIARVNARYQQEVLANWGVR